jgi:biopolymer transport protein ExbD/biopolymer transport protein TolR
MAIVVFTLLVFMMMAGNHGQLAYRLDLPKAHNSVALRRANLEDATVISITRDGRIYFGSDPAQPCQLQVMIRRSLASGAERKVYLRVDPRAKYGDVMSALNGVISATLDKVAFLVENYLPPESAGP